MKRNNKILLFFNLLTIAGLIFFYEENRELKESFSNYYEAVEVDKAIQDKDNSIKWLKSEVNRQERKYNALLNEDFDLIAEIMKEKQ